MTAAGAERVRIVGIGDDGVDGMTAHARRLVESADVLLGAIERVIDKIRSGGAVRSRGRAVR